MTRSIAFTAGAASAVLPTSYTIAGAGELFGTGGIWFSFGAAGHRWTNLDPVWLFIGDSTRQLTNGGTEFLLRFEGTGRARGLRWEVAIQCFPGSTLSRERLTFSAPQGSGLIMSEGTDGPLLVFPGYRFRHPASLRVHERSVSLAVWGADLISAPNGASFDDRFLESGTRVGKNLAQNYCYHPAESCTVLMPGDERSSPGPILFVESLAGGQGVFLAYEHGAPDRDPEQEYIHFRRVRSDTAIDVSTVYRRGLGGGRALDGNRQVVSVWHVLGAYDARSPGAGPALVRDYLQDKITEASASRIPRFYYNTWGMQRDEERKGADVRGVLTPGRILQEIELAHRMNVELFVLDDGWQKRFGDWVPDEQRFPTGLAWYVEDLTTRGMVPGIWIAPIATDPASPLALSHPGWLIRDDHAHPIVGRWEKNIFCFASAYRAEFIASCKKLIDAGIRYFKWDGIDKHLCSSPDHEHGTVRQTAAERREMQGFAMPLLIADAMRQLREYCPDVVVEMDVTEPGRSVGLAVLSEGKYFWMNNGAGAYGDYSTRRAKSTRFIPSLYHAFIPPALQTYACYPHNDPVHAAQRYNVNSALIGGWGFWGNLATLTNEDIGRIGEVVAASRQVLSHVGPVATEVTGAVCASPEVYALVDCRTQTGQIVAFSSTALAYRYAKGDVCTDSVLAVLRNAFEVRDDSVIVPFTFPVPESSREAFIVSNRGAGITILSSTSWLRDARISGGDTLHFTPGAGGVHRIRWERRLGLPAVKAGPGCGVSMTMPDADGGVTEAYLVEIRSTEPGSTISVMRRH